MVRLGALTLALCAAVATATAPVTEGAVMPLHTLTAAHVRSVVKDWSLKALASCLFAEEVGFAAVASRCL